MMLRVGGSVLSSEHLNADSVQIFFDGPIDSLSFLEDKTDSENY